MFDTPVPFVLDIAPPNGVVATTRTGNHTLYSVQTPGAARSRIETFIRDRFWQAFTATPVIRVPELVALCDQQNALLAAVGLRNASSGRLFLEDYLNQPLDVAISALSPCRRDQIVEIAHLAGVQRGVSRSLFPALTFLLHGRGVQWVAFTGTRTLRVSFERLGVKTLSLGIADPSRLPDGGQGWGDYYEHQPEVLISHLPSGYQILADKGLFRGVEFLASEDIPHALIA